MEKHKLKTSSKFVVRTDEPCDLPPHHTCADVFVSSFHISILNGNKQFFQCDKLSSEFI
jgi:hypothetical protein